MRYKATYRPTYVLGTFLPFPPVSSYWYFFSFEDPESYSYFPLDLSLLARLTHRPYVSVSRDRRLGLDSTSSNTPSILQLDHACASDFNQESKLGSDKFSSDLDYINGQYGPSASVTPEAASLFEKDMPGVMSAKEVCQMKEFDCWRMKVGDTIFELQVYFYFLVICSIPISDRLILIA